MAIPAFNRPETLIKILDVLIHEPTDRFEILIADDSTTEQVKSLILDYQKLIKNLHYEKNEENLGFNLNVAKLYEKCKTRYVWFLCDDDQVKQGAIVEIIESLEKYQPVVAIYNCTWKDSYGRLKIAGPTKDMIYTDIKSFADYSALMRITFLSIVIVEKGFPIKEILLNPKCTDNVFIQLTLALQLLSNNFKLCLISKSIVYRDVGYNYGEFYKFILVDPLRAIYLLPHKFDNIKFNKWMMSQLPDALRLFLSQKADLFLYNGIPKYETLKDVIKYYRLLSIPIFLFRISAFFVPPVVIKFIYLVQLIKIYNGLVNGYLIYKKLVGRAKRDSRITGFIDYK